MNADQQPTRKSWEADGSAAHRKIWMATGKGNLGMVKSQKQVDWCTHNEWYYEEYTILDIPTFSYAKLDKKTQAELKKHLSFSNGAKYQGNLRKAIYLELRDTINLDLDKLEPQVYDSVIAAAKELGWAYLHVGSASNGVNGKRSGRLIFPLSRAVEPKKEFAAVSRKIAERVGIEFVDPVSHRANQICYAPARCSDAPKVFEVIDGPWLDVDGCLAEYSDWKDTAEWPRAKRESAVFSEMAVLGDPRDKPHLIGSFCRKYDFIEAIEEFDLPYDRTDDDMRWTPHGATSAGGARLYGPPGDPEYPAWMYNDHEHGLSPKRNICAYDAVRLHKFGDLDDALPESTRVQDRPSVRAMNEWIRTEHPDIVTDASTRACANEFEDLGDDEPATYQAILDLIEAQPAEGCSVEIKSRICKTIAAAADLQPTEEKHLVKVLKGKLPGVPAVADIRQDIALLRRQETAKRHPLPKDAELVIFRNHARNTVYGGVFDPATGKFVPDLELAEMDGATGIAQLCGMFGVAPISPQQLNLGIFEFRPGKTPQVTKTASGYRVNTWTAPEIREMAVPSDTLPPNLFKLLLHVLGGDEVVVEHFLNWLACAYQQNDRTGTAWILSGCPGTGKGILFDEIITPLFGASYCCAKLTKDLESDFNGWFARCLMLNVDEAKTAGFQAPRVEAALRRYCTAPQISVNEKHVRAEDRQNYCNVIITSNEERPISISPGDRRYTVAPRQEKSLVSLGIDTENFVNSIRLELPQFAGFLASYKIDKERARRPLHTEQREIMIESSGTTPERISRAVKDGDVDFFLEEFWTAVGGTDLFNRPDGTEHVRKILLGWAESANLASPKRLSHMKVLANHVAAVFNFLMPEKFKRSPQDIGRVLGLKADCFVNRSRAYRIVWVTKETSDGMADVIRRLENFESEQDQSFADSVLRRPISKTNGRSEPAHSSESAEVANEDSMTRSASNTVPLNSASDVSWDDCVGVTHPRDTLMRQLGADQEVVDILMREGFSSSRQIAEAPVDEFRSIKEFDSGLIGKLVAAARRAQIQSVGERG